MIDTNELLWAVFTRWVARYPKHEKRLRKAARLVLAGKVAPRGLSSWRVVGSKGATHLVEVECGFPRCSCPYQGRCSHIWAAAMLVRWAADIEEAVQEVLTRQAPKPRKVYLSKALGAHCRKLHDNNQANMERLPLAEVIPLRR